MQEATFHQGGHITWLFTVESDADDESSQGSRGAGICIEDGVTVRCQALPRTGERSVRAKGRGPLFSNFDMVPLHTAVVDECSRLSPRVRDLDWNFDIDASIPLSQGFGLSAAGAIAAARCVLTIAPPPDFITDHDILRAALAVAHSVERRTSGGLGDVMALAVGGVERRLAPGSPFHQSSGGSFNAGPGRAEAFASPSIVLLAWRAASDHHTSEYIDDLDWQERIRTAGSRCMETLGDGKWGANRWQELLAMGERFALECGLLADAGRKDILAAAHASMERARAPVAARLCMLGESVSIVATDPDLDDGWVTVVESSLQSAGFSTRTTRIAALRGP